MAAFIGLPIIGDRSGGPQELIAMRDPGLRKPRTRPAAPSPSGSKMIPHRDTAASKLSAGKSSAEASACMNSMLLTPASAARSRP
jgi:hypothetical protein